MVSPDESREEEKEVPDLDIKKQRERERERERESWQRKTAGLRAGEKWRVRESGGERVGESEKSHSL